MRTDMGRRLGRLWGTLGIVLGSLGGGGEWFCFTFDSCCNIFKVGGHLCRTMTLCACVETAPERRGYITISLPLDTCSTNGGTDITSGVNLLCRQCIGIGIEVHPISLHRTIRIARSSFQEQAKGVSLPYDCMLLQYPATIPFAVSKQASKHRPSFRTERLPHPAVLDLPLIPPTIRRTLLSRRWRRRRPEPLRRWRETHRYRSTAGRKPNRWLLLLL